MARILSGEVRAARREKELTYWKGVGRALRAQGYSWPAPSYRYPHSMRLLLPLRGTWITGYKVAGDRVGVFFRAKGEARSRIRQAASMRRISLQALPSDVRLADISNATTYITTAKARTFRRESEEQLWLASNFTQFADLFMPLMNDIQSADPILVLDEVDYDPELPRLRRSPAEIEQAIRDALF